jgi:hypothetical protein
MPMKPNSIVDVILLWKKEKFFQFCESELAILLGLEKAVTKKSLHCYSWWRKEKRDFLLNVIE